MCKIINVTGKEEYSNAIYDIDMQCFPSDFWSQELISKELKSGRQDYFVFLYEGQMVAYLNGFSIQNEAELTRIAVVPAFRKKGIANRLLKEYIKYLQENYCIKLMLEVRKGNVAAINLYNSLGFKTDAIRKDYYTNPTEDAYLMSLEFKEGKTCL